MKSEDKSYRRYSLFLPINDNTQEHLWDIITYVHHTVGGCTYTRFHYPAISIEGTEISGYLIGKYEEFPEEDVICIMTDIELNNNVDLHTKLKTLIKRIEELGEKEVWLTYHDIILGK